MPVADDGLDEARRVVARSGWLAGWPAAFRRSLLAHARLLRFEKGDRAKFNLDLADGVLLKTQERACTSPIWYSPED